MRERICPYCGAHLDPEERCDCQLEDPEEKNAGYEEIGTGIFVREEDAYQYALERISQDEGLKQEFVEWFYSGNWVEE